MPFDCCKMLQSTLGFFCVEEILEHFQVCCGHRGWLISTLRNCSPQRQLPEGLKHFSKIKGVKRENTEDHSKRN